MLISNFDIPSRVPEARDNAPALSLKVPGGNALRRVNDPETALTESIGLLKPDENIHFYSHGNFNLVRLILYLMKQTGPVHVMMSSYSFSQKSIESLQRKLQNGDLLSFRVIVDSRVKTMSPKPFQMLSTSFDYRCIAIHAKVALLWNHSWHLSIVTSQNATDNPKIERGTIFTDPAVFDFDLKSLEDVFLRATT